MTLDEAEKLVRAIDDFDAEAYLRECRVNDEDPRCLACEATYCLTAGCIPTALDDDCARDTVTDFARILRAVLPVVKAAEAWSRKPGMEWDRSRGSAFGRENHALANAIDTMHQVLK